MQINLYSLRLIEILHYLCTQIQKYVFRIMENKTFKRTTVTSALPYANGCAIFV